MFFNIFQTSLDAHPDAKSLSVSLAFSPALLRLSQGLVHTSTLAAHVWLNSSLAGVTGSGCNQNDPASLLLNHYIICNDTMEDLHIRQVKSYLVIHCALIVAFHPVYYMYVCVHQEYLATTTAHLPQFSTDEDTVLCNGECAGYSWRSHVIIPRQLQLCVVVHGVQQWTEPFSVCGPGVQRLDVGDPTTAVFVRVTQLGGLQKQVSLFRLFELYPTYSCVHVFR